ncbi:hypothetical protein C8Q80DRAFT_819048 [Daedaleopsis nitida]|nr:hypothetical protein C8Q80DRAFT_819048 [Daedaleopsis nitida]
MAKSKNIACPHCTRRFKKEAGCRQHILDKHPGMDTTPLIPPSGSLHKLFICYQCKAVFPSKASRKEHAKLTLHQSTEPPLKYECYECTKPFKTPSRREEHGLLTRHQWESPARIVAGAPASSNARSPGGV